MLKPTRKHRFTVRALLAALLLFAHLATLAHEAEHGQEEEHGVCITCTLANPLQGTVGDACVLTLERPPLSLVHFAPLPTSTPDPIAGLRARGPPLAS